MVSGATRRRRQGRFTRRTDRHASTTRQSARQVLLSLNLLRAGAFRMRAAIAPPSRGCEVTVTAFHPIILMARLIVTVLSNEIVLLNARMILFAIMMMPKCHDGLQLGGSDDLGPIYRVVPGGYKQCDSLAA